MASIPPNSSGTPASQPPVGPPSAPPRKKKRRWLFRLFWLVVICLVLIAIAPYLASSIPFVRNGILSMAVPNLNGSITAEDASLGWDRPIQFKGVTIKTPVGIPVVQIDELGGDRPLWKILLKPSVLGTYRVVRPHLMLVAYSNGTTNLSEVFTGTDPLAAKPTKPRGIPDLSLAVELVDGKVTVSDSLGKNTWNASPINFKFRLLPSSQTPDGRARLEIPRVKMFDHIQVTPEVSHGMLKYIAPVMADVTDTEGAFSIDLDNWSLPLETPAEGQGKGVLTVHKLSVAAGPVIRPILTTLGIGGDLMRMDETPIQFELADGHVRHEGFVFYVEKIKFMTSGSVKIEDESLDLKIQIQLPEKARIQRPVMQALAGQTITIPVRGTLTQPQVDARKLSQSGIKAFQDVLDRLKAPLPGTSDSTKTPPSGDGTKAGSRAEPAVDVDAILNTVEELRRRRQEQLKENPNARPLLNLPRLDPNRDRPLLKRILEQRESDKK